MTSFSQAIARVLLPLALGVFAFTSSASAEKVEELKDYCGEINQLVTESQGWIFANSQDLIAKYRTLCPKLVLSMTNQALKDTAAKGMVVRITKDLAKALKDLAKTIGLPGEINLEDALEKGLEKLDDAARKKAKEELQKALKKVMGDGPAAYKYKKEGSVDGCDYTMTVVWNVADETYEVRTTGDCHCKIVKTREGEGKLGKWQSNIKGVAKVNAKFGAGELVIGLDVTPQSYSGAGDCACGKNDISMPEERTENISLPDPPVEVVTIPEEHRRDRDHRRDYHDRHDHDRVHLHDHGFGHGRGSARMLHLGGHGFGRAGGRGMRIGRLR